MHHQINLRLSPGGTRFLYWYGQTNAIVRLYLTPGHGPATIAQRLVGDVLLGELVPQELAP
jgi:hypothetical protein